VSQANPAIDFSFDDKAEDAQRAAEKAAAKMVKGVTEETEKAIRAAILKAIRDGVPPYEAAELIHDLIGLTSAQAQAVAAYKEQLIAGSLLPSAAAERAEEYADELLDVRAENIARYEIMDALNSGQEEAWLQAQEEGLLTDDATKEWVLSEDPCDECEAAAKAGPVPVGDEFPDGDPPLHPRCRCTTGIARP
jgi:hypothetical protein